MKVRGLLAAIVGCVALWSSTNIVVGQWAGTGRPIQRLDRWLGVGNGHGYHWRTPGHDSSYYQPWSHLNTSSQFGFGYPGEQAATNHFAAGQPNSVGFYYPTESGVPMNQTEFNQPHSWPHVLPLHAPLPPAPRSTVPPSSPPPNEQQETTWNGPHAAAEAYAQNFSMPNSAMPIQISANQPAPRSIWNQAIGNRSTTSALNTELDLNGPVLSGSSTEPTGATPPRQAQQWVESLQRQGRVYQR